jgi:membrane protein DedA with SNARE-associated domain
MHGLILIWFNLVKSSGYMGVIVLMALESTIIPVPSEVIIPPAAFWAAQGEFNFWALIICAVIGSYLGSAISYMTLRWAKGFFDKNLAQKFQKITLINEKKMQMLEAWVHSFGVPGIFFARLLPVVRHLISIPAGLFKLDFLRFSLATIVGSAIWCTVLAYWGVKVIGPHPELLNSPEDMMRAVRTEMHGFLFGILVLILLYTLVVWVRRKLIAKPTSLS